MRKFYLRTVIAGSTHGDVVECDGFLEAEAKAKELYYQVHDNYPGEDTFVACSSTERDVRCLDTSVLTLREDYFGDLTWFYLVYGYYCYSHDRLLDDGENAELEEWRNEKDIHIWDLSEDDLKKLRGEIRLGSMFLSDYNNSFYIDTEEVSDYAEDYEQFLEEEGLEDTPQQFADYISDK